MKTGTFSIRAIRFAVAGMLAIACLAPAAVVPGSTKVDPVRQAAWNAAQQQAGGKIDRFDAAVKSGNADAIRQATLELQADPIAVQKLNNGGRRDLIDRHIAETQSVRNATKENIKQDMAGKWNADHPNDPITPDDVEIFEPTNYKKPGAEPRTPQDWDVTVRVRGKDVPPAQAKGVVEGSFYKAAGGEKTFGKGSTPESVAHKQAIEVTDSGSLESYKEPDKILGGKDAPPDPRSKFNDPQDLGEVIDYKSNLARNKADAARAKGNQVEGVRQDFEQMRQAVKQYDKITDPRVKAQGGKVGSQVEAGMKVMRDVADMKISPEEGRAKLAEMGETPESITRKAAGQIEAAQKLKPPEAPKATAPDTPKTPAPDAPKGTVPDAPKGAGSSAGKTAVAPDAPKGIAPDAPKGSVPDAPKGVVPDAPKGVVPDAPKGTVPDAPKGAVPDAPKGVVPDAPKGIAPDTPKGVAPDAPKGVVPDAPKGAVPDAPKGVVPDAPKGVVPDAPKGVVPDAPKGIAPDAPKGVVPDVPDAPKGAVPDAPKGVVPDAPKGVVPDVPDVPKGAVPDAPKGVVPDAPKVTTPDAPKAATPDVPSGKVGKALKGLNTAGDAIDLFGNAQDFTEAAQKGDTEGMKKAVVNTADSFTGGGYGTGKMVEGRAQEGGKYAAEVEGLDRNMESLRQNQIELDLRKAGYSQSQAEAMVANMAKGDDGAVKDAYQKMGKDMPAPSSAGIESVGEAVSVYGAEVKENLGELGTGLKTQAGKAGTFLKNTASNLGEMGVGVTESGVASELAGQVGENLSSGNLKEGYDAWQQSKQADAQVAEGRQGLEDALIAKGAKPSEAKQAADRFYGIGTEDGRSDRNAVRDLNERLEAKKNRGLKGAEGKSDSADGADGADAGDDEKGGGLKGFKDKRDTRTGENADSSYGLMGENQNVSQASTQGDRAAADAKNTVNAAGADAQAIKDKAEAAKAAADREQSLGKAVADGVEEGVKTGASALGASFGKSAGGHLSDKIFDDGKKGDGKGKGGGKGGEGVAAGPGGAAPGAGKTASAGPGKGGSKGSGKPGKDGGKKGKGDGGAKGDSKTAGGSSTPKTPAPPAPPKTKQVKCCLGCGGELVYKGIYYADGTEMYSCPNCKSTVHDVGTGAPWTIKEVPDTPAPPATAATSGGTGGAPASGAGSGAPATSSTPPSGGSSGWACSSCGAKWSGTQGTCPTCGGAGDRLVSPQ